MGNIPLSRLFRAPVEKKKTSLDIKDTVEGLQDGWGIHGVTMR